jgi:chromosomal replication initiation ATPase DnaA
MPVRTLAESRIWPISLEQIEATVADYLSPGRVKSNSPASAFSRHISMYLARRVGGLSYAKISRFYDRRHHTSVIAAIGKIEKLRASNESVDVLIDMLTATLSPECSPTQVRAHGRRRAERQATA